MFNNTVNIGIYYGIFSNNLQTAGEALVAGKQPYMKHIHLTQIIGLQFLY